MVSVKEFWVFKKGQRAGKYFSRCKGCNAVDRGRSAETSGYVPRAKLLKVLNECASRIGKAETCRRSGLSENTFSRSYKCKKTRKVTYLRAKALLDDLDRTGETYADVVILRGVGQFVSITSSALMVKKLRQVMSQGEIAANLGIPRRNLSRVEYSIYKTISIKLHEKIQRLFEQHFPRAVERNLVVLNSELSPILKKWMDNHDREHNWHYMPAMTSAMTYIIEKSEVTERTIGAILRCEWPTSSVRLADRLLTAIGMNHCLGIDVQLHNRVNLTASST